MAKLAMCSVQLLTTTAAALQQVAEQIASVASEMGRREIPEMLLPWNPRQNAAFDILVTAGDGIESAAKKKFIADDQQRQPHSDVVLARRVKRQKKEAAAKAGADIPRGPGRPRKAT